MTDQKDPLSGAVSIEARIDKSGLKAGAKSRAVVAIDRLCGGMIDIFGAAVEGVPQRIRARNEIKEDLIRVEGGQAADKLRDDPSAGDRVLDRFLADQTTKQSNRDAIARKALADLDEVRPTEEDEKSQIGIDQDWINVFSSHADNASTERLQDMWGRILAGEIRRPKSFSLSTLRIVAELDQEIAEIFQHTVRSRLHAGYLPRPGELKGKTLSDMMFLEEVGLLQSISDVSQELLPRSDGYVYFFNGEYCLRLKRKPDDTSRLLQIVAEDKVSLNIIGITRAGREIASILPKEDDDFSLRAVAESVSDQVASIELCGKANKVNEEYEPDDPRSFLEVLEHLKAED